MKISIIIPIYNVEPYIARCLQSVMDQTYGGPVECLLVDDCGNDKSVALAEEMISQYRGQIDFKMLHHDHNRGLSAARNTGTDAATGDYVYYLDSDDAMTPDCLALMAAEIEKYPNVEMVVGAHRGIYEDASNNYLTRMTPCYVDNNEWIRFQYFKEQSGLTTVAWNKLMCLDFLNSNSLRFKEGVVHEDEHWSFYVYRKLNKLAIIEDVTYLHYRLPNTIMSNCTKQSRANNIYSILLDLVNDFNEPCCSLQVFKYLEHFRFHVLPYLPKNQMKSLYFRFLKWIIRIGQFRIGFYLLVNWYHDFRHSQLHFKMIPEAYSVAEECVKKQIKGYEL